MLWVLINRNLRGLPAIVYGDGSQTRCFSYVDDCVVCLEKMALDPKVVSQIINIGPDTGTVSIKELAELVAEATGFTGEIIHMPDRPREVKHADCSADKARWLLNYETKTSLEQSIKETIEYIKLKGPKKFDYSYPLEIVNEKIPKTWSERLM